MRPCNRKLTQSLWARNLNHGLAAKAGQQQQGSVFLFIKLQFPQARRVHPLADLHTLSREAKERFFSDGKSSFGMMFSYFTPKMLDPLYSACWHPRAHLKWKPFMQGKIHKFRCTFSPRSKLFLPSPFGFQSRCSLGESWSWKSLNWDMESCVTHMMMGRKHILT